MKEIWKPVVGHEEHYHVSNLGRIKSLSRYKLCTKGRFAGFKYLMKEKILKLSPTNNKNSKGYLMSVGGNDNIKYKLYPHKEVAKAFIPNPNKKPCVNHIDSDTFNNLVSNLEWVTHKENSQHAAAKGRFGKKLGLKFPNGYKKKTKK